MKTQMKHNATGSNEITNLEKQNLQVAYEAALEGIVLLENDGCLPVVPGKIALYGAGAEMTVKGGTGSGEVNERHAVSILEGLEKAGYTVTTKNWLEGYRQLYAEKEREYGKAFRKRLFSLKVSTIINIMSSPFQPPYGQPVTEKDLAESETDTCVYVVARQAGEGSDRRLGNGDYNLTEIEKDNIVKCAAHYDKMIVVINVGAGFDMSFLDEIQGINAVVYYGQQGTMGGQAFADLLSGKVTPSGKLTDTWAKKYEDIPFANEYSYLNGNLEQEYYKEGIYVGYRYFDSFGVAPRYPFGYGLSYTRFAIKVVRLKVEKSTIKLKVSVQNIGDTYAGQEVVQAYVSCPSGVLHKEYQSLVCFGKTRVLTPGEACELELSFDLRTVASYREEDASFVLEAGEYLLRVGNSGRNTGLSAVIALDSEAVVSRHEHICPVQCTVEELVAPFGEEMLLQSEDHSQGGGDSQEEAILRYVVKAEDIVTIEYGYKTPEIESTPEMDAILSKLDTSDKVALTVGSGLFGKGAYFKAPGCAGNTTGKLVKKGVPNVCLSDGPAGLRLQKRSAVMKNGKLKAIDPIMTPIKYLPKMIKNVILANSEKHPVVYQYATAFPVELSLAQTWNISLLEKVGDAIGKEMEAYGVTYWLAPALNIHRNPLCGRNFEYYSEDPVLSGTMAAAVTRGVQKHQGCYVTLKHFCCNNQEDNRNKTNANVSERVLREIYLKGFEIAVRSSNPGAVMTSYNLVNGVYTCNSHDLVTKVLRNEWGFGGVVMTDWHATGKGLGSHSLALAAGNDLIMPGGTMAEGDIKKAMKRGKLSAEDLERCAANVLKGIMTSGTYQKYIKENK